MTFFYREMRPLIEAGHLFLAQPPLYRLSAGGEIVYARDDAHRERLMATTFKGKKVELSRFKGLGEMDPRQLRETTMDPGKRTLLQVRIAPEAGEPELGAAGELVEQLMGRRPELRLAFIQANARLVDELDV
jgi:topoisomerase-4 subunit B